MTSAREFLVREVERLSEEDAREVLELLKRRQAAGIGPATGKVTREDLLERLAGNPGIHVPDPDAPPFEKLEPIATRGIPASQLLIADRR
jgi:16S rRNA C967 or C1407 C5-methylase (RsmB/RsmF family)